MIFDVDGTLVDSNAAYARAWVQAFTEQGITVAYESVRRALVAAIEPNQQSTINNQQSR